MRKNNSSTQLVICAVLLLTLAGCGGDSDSDNTNPNEPDDNDEVAVDAGADQSIEGRQEVTVSATVDNASDVDWQWVFAQQPAASALSDSDITNADQAQARFTPDAAGSYRLQVEAQAGGVTVTDTLDVQARISVDAGDDQSLEGQQEVDLQADTELKANTSY